MISNDDLYRRSTQYRYWSFTRSKLEDLRILANKKGIDFTKRRLQDLDPDLPETKAIKEINISDYPFVTSDEELKIVTYYARKCKDLAKFFHLPSQARATAIMYLYKFYLAHSVMVYHPQYIMYTCLFLAAKVENSFIGINNFSKAIPKTTPDSILQYEYLILQSLRFSLRCHHPYQPLYGFYLDIQELLPKVDFKRLGRSCDSARELVNESLFTNVPFLFTPPQVALACLWKSDAVLVERYLAKKLGLKRKQIKSEMETIREEEVKEESTDESTVESTQASQQQPAGESSDHPSPPSSPQQNFDKLMLTIRKCVDMLEHNTMNPSMEEAKHISSKIRFCLEPLRYGKKLIKQKIATAALVESANAKRSNSSELESEPKKQRISG
ncbi:DEKNAAC105111 [Brettanomyces naardenensis]|uniref:DEKNAAC105111 n=1 Tax=Brettanomyces naardenensis TaxID=13370 RepID=A0A448YT45_BRENA|nr:DEKNAAC105111 [Brettanomyces naardenensis]